MAAVLRTVRVVERKEQEIGYSSHEQRRVLGSHRVQLVAALAVVHSLEEEVAVDIENRADRVIELEGGPEDMKSELPAVPGCSRSHNPAGEDEGGLAGHPIGLEGAVL